MLPHLKYIFSAIFDVLAKKVGEFLLVGSLILQGNRPLGKEFCPKLRILYIIDKEVDAANKRVNE